MNTFLSGYESNNNNSSSFVVCENDKKRIPVLVLVIH